MCYLLAATVSVCNGGAISCLLLLLLPVNIPPIILASCRATGNDFAIHCIPCKACL
jgi:hypothetical protein